MINIDQLNTTKTSIKKYKFKKYNNKSTHKYSSCLFYSTYWNTFKHTLHLKLINHEPQPQNINKLALSVHSEYKLVQSGIRTSRSALS